MNAPQNQPCRVLSLWKSISPRQSISPSHYALFLSTHALGNCQALQQLLFPSNWWKRGGGEEEEKEEKEKRFCSLIPSGVEPRCTLCWSLEVALSGGSGDATAPGSNSIHPPPWSRSQPSTPAQRIPQSEKGGDPSVTGAAGTTMAIAEQWEEKVTAELPGWAGQPARKD